MYLKMKISYHRNPDYLIIDYDIKVWPKVEPISPELMEEFRKYCENTEKVVQEFREKLNNGK